MVAHEVVDGLYVGDASAAMQLDVNAFDLIVNVTREVPFSKLLRPDEACAIVRRAHPRAWDHGCYVHYREALAALDPSR